MDEATGYEIDMLNAAARLRARVWVTREGERIPLNKMPSDHLQNLERWLRFDGVTQPNPALVWQIGRGWHRAVLDELELRGLARSGKVM